MRRLVDSFALTEAEQRTHYYQTAGRLRAVRPFIVGSSVVLSASSRVVAVPYRATARCRVVAVTWSGDTNAMKVLLYKERGDRINDYPIHIPALAGLPMASTYESLAFPTSTAVPSAAQSPAERSYILGAQFVVARGENFLCEYSLENPTDGEVAAGRSWTVFQALHLVEFP